MSKRRKIKRYLRTVSKKDVVVFAGWLLESKVSALVLNKEIRFLEKIVFLALVKNFVS